MKTSLNGKIALMVSEGVVVNPYKDVVGVWTLGVGHTAKAGRPDPEKFRGEDFTLEQVMEIFSRDLAKFERRVNDLVTVSITQNEFDALVHFDFNTGGLHKSRLLRLLNEGEKQKAFETGFHGWLKPASLKGRRDKERAIALHGDYGPDTGLLYTADYNGKLGAGRSVNFREMLKPTKETPKATPAPIPIAVGAGGLAAAIALFWNEVKEFFQWIF